MSLPYTTCCHRHTCHPENIKYHQNHIYHDIIVHRLLQTVPRCHHKTVTHKVMYLLCHAKGWTTGRSGFDPRQGQRIFPLTSVSRPTLRPTQPPVQWVPGVLSPGVKARPGRDADHSPPFSAEVVNE
jgi:hypothetical protein